MSGESLRDISAAFSASLCAEVSWAASDAMKHRAASSPSVHKFDDWRALVSCAKLGLAPLTRGDIGARMKTPANRVATSIQSAGPATALVAMAATGAALTGGALRDILPQTPTDFERCWRRFASDSALNRLAWLARLGDKRLRALWCANGGSSLASDGSLLSSVLDVAACAATGSGGAGGTAVCGPQCAAKVINAVSGGDRWHLAVAMLTCEDRDAVRAIAGALKTDSVEELTSSSCCASCGGKGLYGGDLNDWTITSKDRIVDLLLRTYGC